MKKRLSPFVAGMATMALLGSLGVSALAATGAFTITVNPINIQVNGETFQPKDANGNDVPVFSLDGTTYAPLRALAEAYGLEVGYDAGSNMATVGTKAEEAADIVLTEEPWNVVIGETTYKHGAIIVNYSTHILCEALLTACTNDELRDALSDLLHQSSLVRYDGQEYINARDANIFLADKGVTLKLHIDDMERSMQIIFTH